jgi:hypothetical protein
MTKLIKNKLLYSVVILNIGIAANTTVDASATNKVSELTQQRRMATNEVDMYMRTLPGVPSVEQECRFAQLRLRAFELEFEDYEAYIRDISDTIPPQDRPTKDRLQEEINEERATLQKCSQQQQHQPI